MWIDIELFFILELDIGIIWKMCLRDFHSMIFLGLSSYSSIGNKLASNLVSYQMRNGNQHHL
jgi:hypothetical protein